MRDPAFKTLRLKTFPTNGSGCKNKGEMEKKIKEKIKI
jgi:hypothetical protein